MASIKSNLLLLLCIICFCCCWSRPVLDNEVTSLDASEERINNDILQELHALHAPAGGKYHKRRAFFQPLQQQQQLWLPLRSRSPFLERLYNSAYSMPQFAAAGAANYNYNYNNELPPLATYELLEPFY
ncbi:uncharacterized protein LOC108607933 [Drosophila busckii]|uniref:uncharacterized protein LOC108607933 n=1 Tax=Drosophila busckii TaxID=30019 RepID=UPI00083EFF32|nr:uncharacterized protein LOC108607933 [Drosophila busckii]